MKEFGIIAVEDELKKIEQLAKESEMEYVRTEKLSIIEKMLYGMSQIAPEMYYVIVSGTEEQFNELIEGQKKELTRVF